MNLQDYVNVAISGIMYNTRFIISSFLIIFIFLGNLNTNQFGKYKPIFKFSEVIIAVLLVGFLLLQIVSFKNDALIQTPYLDWIKSFGQLSYFLAENNVVHQQNVLMLIYFTIGVKGTDVVNALLDTIANDLIQIALLISVCCVQIFGLIWIVPKLNILFPLIACALILLNVVVICDKIFHFAYHKLKILPKTIYITHTMILKRFSGVLYTFVENQNGKHIRVHANVHALLCIFTVLLIFVKDLFFKDITV